MKASSIASKFDFLPFHSSMLLVVLPTYLLSWAEVASINDSIRILIESSILLKRVLYLNYWNIESFVREL